MLKNKIVSLKSQGLPQRTVEEFTQLLGFIDRSITEAIKLDGPDKIQALSNTLISMRDYMKVSLTQDGYRQIIIGEIDAALNYKEPEPEQENPDFSKKNLDLGTAQASDQ